VISESNIRTETPVYTANGQLLGTVQEVRDATIIVNRLPPPGDTIARTNADTVYCQQGVTSDRGSVAARGKQLGIEDSYQRARPNFEADFATRASAVLGDDTQGRTFAHAEPTYRAGFMAGHDLHYEGRTFEDVEPDLRREYETSITDTGEHTSVGEDWARLREEIRAGFRAARGCLD